MKIIIDGDACPVKEDVFELSAQHSICVTLVSNFSHFSQKELPTHITQIYVDTGPDSADYRIVSIAKERDIIITQDYGLASLLLQKNCRVIHHNGTEYSQSTINQMLSIREVNSKLRQKGIRTKGPKPYTNEMRQEFRDKLNQLLN